MVTLIAVLVAIIGPVVIIMSTHAWEIRALEQARATRKREEALGS